MSEQLDASAGSACPTRHRGHRLLVRSIAAEEGLQRDRHQADCTTARTGPTWTTRAVDTVRVLAVDAVQKVGNGHPGTAMSLAPAAYLLFQKVMRHDPADPDWPGRDRFVLSCGHSSLTLYIQLYLGRLRPGARRPQGAAHLGHPDPGPPGVRPHRRRRDHHRPARPGRRQRRRHGDGRPPRARPVRPGRRRRARASFDHHDLRDRLRRRPRGGHHRRGVLARRHTSSSATSTLLYDDNHISIEDDTDIAFTEDVAGALRGVRLARADASTGPTAAPAYDEDVAGAVRRRSRRPRR